MKISAELREMQQLKEVSSCEKSRHAQGQMEHRKTKRMPLKGRNRDVRPCALRQKDCSLKAIIFDPFDRSCFCAMLRITGRHRSVIRIKCSVRESKERNRPRPIDSRRQRSLLQMFVAENCRIGHSLGIGREGAV